VPPEYFTPLARFVGSVIAERTAGVWAIPGAVAILP
jgi:hypothetical protein